MSDGGARASGQQSEGMVSVIMPCFNAEATIVRAVESALAQTHLDVELIIADDASTDGSIRAVGTAFPDHGAIRVIELPRNQGPAHARNVALDHARGAWVALLDTDDAWRPGRLTSMLRQAGNADAVFDNLTGYDQVAGRETGTLFPMFTPGPLTVPALLAPQVAGSRYDYGYLRPLMRREFLEAQALRYDETLRTSEDLVFYLRMLIAGARAVMLDDTGYIYTTPVGHHSGRVSVHSKTTPRDDQVRLVLEDLLDRYRSGLSPEDAAAIEDRIGYMRAIAPVAKFYYARRHGAYARMAWLLVSNAAVRQDVRAKLQRRMLAR
jgi:succinoglycan biosynthesis protein ExoO